MSVKVVDIYLAVKYLYSPPHRWIIVKFRVSSLGRKVHSFHLNRMRSEKGCHKQINCNYCNLRPTNFVNTNNIPGNGVLDDHLTLLIRPIAAKSC